MSRLDYVTISIVVICLIALGFLVYKTIGLLAGDKPQAIEPIEYTNPDDTAADDEYDLEEGETLSDDYEEGGPASDEDLDDDDLSSSEDYELIDDEEPVSSDDDYEEDSSEDDADYEEAATSTQSIASGNYLVVAGTYRQKINAENQVRKLKRAGFDESRVASFNRGAYAVALVGSHDSRSDAIAQVDQLKDKGFSAFVKTKE